MRCVPYRDTPVDLWPLKWLIMLLISPWFWCIVAFICKLNRSYNITRCLFGLVMIIGTVVLRIIPVSSRVILIDLYLAFLYLNARKVNLRISALFCWAKVRTIINRFLTRVIWRIQHIIILVRWWIFVEASWLSTILNCSTCYSLVCFGVVYFILESRRSFLIFRTNGSRILLFAHISARGTLFYFFRWEAITSELRFFEVDWFILFNNLDSFLPSIRVVSIFAFSLIHTSICSAFIFLLLALFTDGYFGPVCLLWTGFFSKSSDLRCILLKCNSKIFSISAGLFILRGDNRALALVFTWADERRHCMYWFLLGCNFRLW